MKTSTQHNLLGVVATLSLIALLYAPVIAMQTRVVQRGGPTPPVHTGEPFVDGAATVAHWVVVQSAVLEARLVAWLNRD